MATTDADTHTTLDLPAALQEIEELRAHLTTVEDRWASYRTRLLTKMEDCRDSYAPSDAAIASETYDRVWAGWKEACDLVYSFDGHRGYTPERYRAAEPERCTLCAEPAQGYAFINGQRYCHGDTQRVSCYVRAQLQEPTSPLLSDVFSLSMLGSTEEQERRDRLERIDPAAIRSLYRHADQRPDGTYISNGYLPSDRIGHVIIDTVQGLCDLVDFLRLQLTAALDPAPRVVVLDVDGCVNLIEPDLPIRPGIADLVGVLVGSGHQIVLWSAGGAAHARAEATRAGIADMITRYETKPENPMTVGDALEVIGIRPVVQIDDDATERVADWPFVCWADNRSGTSSQVDTESK